MDSKTIKRIVRRKMNFIGAPIYRYVSSDFNRMRIAYTKYYENNPIVPNTILFESRDGQSFTDSPYAMYKQMVRDSRFADYQFYWVYKKEYNLKELQSNFTVEEINRAVFVERNSQEYAKLLATCQYVITNSTFQSFYLKKEGQTYINTWHGTPLKTMGFDIPNNPFASQNVLRNFLMTDYLLSPNAHTSQIFIDSYKLRGLYPGQVVESGYPRIDLTLNTPREAVLLKLRLAGIEIDDDKPIVMYTPTWKGSAVGNPSVNVDQLITEINFLKRNCENQYNILVKVHPYVYDKVRHLDILKGYLIPDCYDANEIMSIVDVLITDYSSIFFDYLVTDKPIIFYAWDKDLYDDERGMYISEDELPGPVVSTIFEVIDALKHVDEFTAPYRQNYEQMKAQMVSYDDGCATERYIDYIFNQKTRNNMTIHEPFEDKHHIIMYPGGMFNNGITTSLINLLDNIDYDHYDVTLLCSTRKNKEVLNNLNKVNSHVRVMFKIGAGDYTIEEQYIDRLLQNRSVTPQLAKYYPEAAYKREARRLSGCCHFESAIDFSGYSYFWAKYIVEMDANRKVVFQHNDLWSDSQKEIDGRHPHLINLRGLFSIYNKFDVLLSVSPMTRDINLEHLGQYADASKFQYCINTINAKKVLGEQSVVEQSDTEDIHPIFEVLKVREDGTYTIVPELSKLYRSYDLSLSQTQTITAIAEIHILGSTLVKVLVDNIYCGWMNKETLTEKEVTIQKLINVDQYARIRRVNEISVYAEPFGLPGAYRRCALGYYRNVIVYVSQIARTDFGLYAHLFAGEREIGWVETDCLASLNQLQENTIQLNHHRYRDVIETAPYYSEERQTVGRVKSMFPVIYNHEYGHRYMKPMEQYSQMNWKNKLVYVEWEMKTEVGVSYKIRDLQGRVGWIRDVDIDVYPFEKAPLVLKQKTFTHYISMKPINEQVKVYETIEDLINEKNEQLVSNQVNAIKRIWTKVGIVLEFQDDKGVTYGKQEDFESVEGLTDIDGNPVDIDSSCLNFVTMGRLSPEKNQLALVQAVSQLLRQQPQLSSQLRLYIIGSGPLQEELEQAIKVNALGNNVILLGQKEDPFSILRQCKCFVLSSIYEGQPMVLLEAMTLGMDIIATNISANAYVLKDGKYGLLTNGTTADDLEKTLNQYIHHRDEMHFETFDYKSYNKKAIQNFYDEI